MSKKFEIYKCSICGNIVEVLFQGNGELVCCGEPMVLQQEKISDVGNEKHVPVIENIDGKTLIKVGSVEHPMLPEHHIAMIEAFGDNVLCRKYLSANEKPQFEICSNKKISFVREYCNLHGLWKNENNL